MHLWWGGKVEEQMHNVDYDPGPRTLAGDKH
jgi:hypothetical protein